MSCPLFVESNVLCESTVNGHFPCTLPIYIVE